MTHPTDGEVRKAIHGDQVEVDAGTSRVPGSTEPASIVTEIAAGTETTITLAVRPRNDTIGKLIEDCAAGRLQFSGPGSLCEKVGQMGYSHAGLYEMVCAAVRGIKL